MSLFTTGQANPGKRQKTALKDATSKVNIGETNEYFPGLTRIEYRPDAGLEDTLCYRHYNATERVHGRPMEDWIRPSISFSQAFHSSRNQDYSSWTQSSFQRPWDDSTSSVDNYKRRHRAAFEFLAKLGVRYWSAWDRDLAPEGETLEESHLNMDECVELVSELQQRSGLKPLWLGPNLHGNNRYSNGGCTSADAQITGYAGAQLKKALEVAQKLGAECFLFRGAREGYSSPLNTDQPRQLRNYARLLKMAADYKERLGYRGQMLFEPNYEDFFENNCAGQMDSSCKDKIYFRYDYDTPSALCFLKHYNLDRQYKISAKPGHQLSLASVYGMLGSIDSTFITSPPNIREATLLMKSVIEHGGMQPGGLNIGIRLRPDSTDLRDLLVSYVSCIDVFAKGLRNAARIVADGVFTKNIQQRYLSFHSGFGSRFVNGEASLEECDEYIRKQNGEVQTTSGKSEHWESVFTRYTENKA